MNHIKKYYSNRIATLLHACQQLPSEIKWHHTDHCIFVFLELPDQIHFASLSARLQTKNVLIIGGDNWYLSDFEKKAAYDYAFTKRMKAI